MAVPKYDFDTAQLRLIQSGVILAQEALDGSTDARRKLAVVLVDLRELFLDDKGRKDYRGESSGYRAAAAAIYDRVRMNKAQRVKLREAINYHVSQVRAERLTAKQLAAYGLNTEARLTARRRRNEEAAQPPRTVAEMGQRLNAFSSLLPDEPGSLDLDGLTPEDARDLKNQIACMARFLNGLNDTVDSFLETQGA